jgi:hypothetical protein
MWQCADELIANREGLIAFFVNSLSFWGLKLAARGS